MRQLVDADFPLTRYGACVFAAGEARPIVIADTEDAADTILHLLNLGYETARLAGDRHAGALDDAGLGAAVYSIVKGEEQLDLPLAADAVEEPGWTLDRRAKGA